MYLYLVFFSDEALARGFLILSGQNWNRVKTVFPGYQRINEEGVQGCIGIIKGEENLSRAARSLIVTSVKADPVSLEIHFTQDQELEVTNQRINGSLYGHSARSDWLDERSNYPLACLVSKSDFDRIRQPPTQHRKASSVSEQVATLKADYNWTDLIRLFEPLATVANTDYWNQADLLYDLAYACSKKGALQNGRGRDQQHLQEIKYFREWTLTLYERCFELEPGSSRSASALGYVHYLNAIELTQPRGRRDGNPKLEVEEAHRWLDQALTQNQLNITDHYRKGKLILDTELPSFPGPGHKWTRETFLEIERLKEQGTSFLKTAIDVYENQLPHDKLHTWKNDYSKALFTLGKFYTKEVRVPWQLYVCSQLVGTDYSEKVTLRQMQLLVEARALLETCFQTQYDQLPDPGMNMRAMVQSTGEEAPQPVYTLYRLGLIALQMYFVRLTTKGTSGTDHGPRAEALFRMALNAYAVAKELGRGSGSSWFISEKLAWYYILTEQHDKACALLQKSRDGYVLNTYALACLLQGSPESYERSEAALKASIQHGHNQQVRKTSQILLLYVYYLSEKKDDYYRQRQAVQAHGRDSKALFELLPSGEQNAR